MGLRRKAHRVSGARDDRLQRRARLHPSGDSRDSGIPAKGTAKSRRSSELDKAVVGRGTRGSSQERPVAGGLR